MTIYCTGGGDTPSGTVTPQHSAAETSTPRAAHAISPRAVLAGAPAVGEDSVKGNELVPPLPTTGSSPAPGKQAKKGEL